jgi:hypothetical protein
MYLYLNLQVFNIVNDIIQYVSFTTLQIKIQSLKVIDFFILMDGLGFEKLLTLQVKVITCLEWKLMLYWNLKNY